LLGVGVACLVTFSIGPPGLILPHATVCQLGADLGTYTVWTPTQIANFPDGGTASVAFDGWNLTMTSGSLTTNPLKDSGPVEQFGSDPNGGLFGSFADFNWTFYRTSNVSVAGGSPDPCTQPFIAQMAVPGGGCGVGAVIPLVDNSTDAVEPHVWNGTPGLNGSETYGGCPVQTPGTYVWFDSSFHAGGSGPAQPVRWDRCNSSGFAPLTLDGDARIPIAVTVPYHGTEISAWGTLTWYDSDPADGPTAVYEVPGGWVWTLAPVGPAEFIINPSQPLPGLVAFERTAC
jgi:hypothetical protein